MNALKISLFAAVLSFACPAPAVDHFVSLSGGHVPPFTTWSEAATNIQDAIDAASAGETVWVTNGVYATGGKVMVGNLTNRVALDKPLLVQSVTGPWATIIQGARDPATTNGPAAVRCAWITNGAVLAGFTLRQGATRGTSTDSRLGNGGGAWCTSGNATLTHYVITQCGAYDGGGAYQGSLVNCTIRENWSSHSGGGVASGSLWNCAVTRNMAISLGGGLNICSAINCTITGNSTPMNGQAPGAGGTYGGGLTNCIIYANSAASTSSASNYLGGGSISYSCSSPLPSGTGNIAADPQLLVDGIHLASTSPCIGAGTNSPVSGVDIDGQSWTNPPSIGCDEWQPAPAVSVVQGPVGTTKAGQLMAGAFIAAGQPPFSYAWLKDGAEIVLGADYSSPHGTNLLINALNPADAAVYSVIVSNSFGVITSAVSQLVIHCVSASSAAPSAPYRDWSTAASTIQDAVDVAGEADVVLVTNGVYSSGGRIIRGDLANRVAVDKALSLMSVNGPETTIIQGAWDPVTTNGPLAVRGVWLGAGATLSGFTVRDGATRDTGDSTTLKIAGGVWCPSALAVVANCIVRNNTAYDSGGGVYNGTLRNCKVLDNRARLSGGGAYYSTLTGSLLQGNYAGQGGGGLYVGTMLNCTVVSNYATTSGGGCQDSKATNCIVYFNDSYAPPGTINLLRNCYVGPSGRLVSSCSTPTLPGAAYVANITSDPQLMSGYHIAATSPCRGTGTNLISGTDLDGESWSNPPPMGCDEVWETGITGSLAVAASALWPAVAERGSMPLTGQVTGWASRVGWDFGDGSLQTNASLLNSSHVWTNAGDYTVAFTAFNADNPNGVSTNLLVHVVPLESPVINSGGLSGTSFSLSFPGQPGVTYVVQQTTNLAPPVTWQTVRTVVSTGSVMQVTDTAATNDMRFYRVQGP